MKYIGEIYLPFKYFNSSISEKHLLSFNKRCKAGAGFLKNLKVRELLKMLKNNKNPFSFSYIDCEKVRALSKSRMYLIVVS